jgi:hypothetical protein
MGENSPNLVTLLGDNISQALIFSCRLESPFKNYPKGHDISNVLYFSLHGSWYMRLSLLSPIYLMQGEIATPVCM